MIKKALLAASVVLLSSYVATASANSAFYIAPSLMYTYMKSGSPSAQSVSPRLAFGYGGLVTDGFYLGGELFADPASITFSDKSKNSRSSVKTSYSVGASILPGYAMSDCMMLFGRLGVVDSRFTGPGKNVGGMQFGVGLQSALTEKWDIRGEYIYTKYNSTKSIGSPQGNQIVLGVVRKFDV